jgi:hypothetical protein
MAIFRVPINLVFPGAGSPGVNVWHIRTTDAGFATELSQANSLIGYIRSFYDAGKTYLPTATSCTLGTVTEEGTAREIVPTMAAVNGLGTSSAPQALALVVTWRTALAARRGRGRTFFGPLTPAACQTDGTPDNTFRNTMVTAAAALVTSSIAFGNGAVGVYGYQNAKLSGKENLRDPNDPKIFRDFTGSGIRDLFGILRSRRD